jgi:outer membrane protein with beta-barrel domain
MTRHLIIATALLAAFLVPPTAYAQEQASLSLGAGLVDPEGVGSTLWITANYRFRIADRLLLEPEVGYWKKGEDILGGDVDVSVEDLDFGLNAVYALADSDAGVVPWIGAGLGLHLVKGIVDFDDDDIDDSASDTDSEIGIHLLGGADFVMSDAFALYAAARFDIVSDLNQFKVYGGVRYRF